MFLQFRSLVVVLTIVSLQSVVGVLSFSLICYSLRSCVFLLCSVVVVDSVNSSSYLKFLVV